jgi:hypothetical protein
MLAIHIAIVEQSLDLSMAPVDHTPNESGIVQRPQGP